MTQSPLNRLVAIYSERGYLLGRVPLAFLYRWPQASFAIAPNGERFLKPCRCVPDDEYCYPLESEVEHES